jgi:hypothetical protein
MEELRNIVKDSLREVFYKTPKERYFIGSVDSYGNVTAKPCDEDSCLSKSHWAHGIWGGRRWRYYPEENIASHYSNVVSWTDAPNRQDVDAVDNFLHKKRINPDKHISLGNSHVYKSGDEYMVETKQPLNESPFGIRLTFEILKDVHPALISKNPHTGEGEYRLTWFYSENMEPAGHVAFGKNEFEYILKNRQLSLPLIGRILHMRPADALMFRDEMKLKFNQEKTPINEALYGIKMTMLVGNVNGFHEERPAIITKNVNPHSTDIHPYRISWFDSNNKPKGHLDIDQKDIQTILGRGTAAEQKVLAAMFKKMLGHPVAFQVEDESKSLSEESKHILQESVREYLVKTSRELFSWIITD